MIRDIYEWLEQENKATVKDIASIKRYQTKKSCSVIQAVLKSGIINISKEDIESAVKEVYKYDLFKGNILDISLLSEISIDTYLQYSFLAAKYINSDGKQVLLLLLTEPKTRLSVMDIVNKLNIKKDIVETQILLEDDFELWREKNKSIISNNQLQGLIDTIEVINLEPTEDTEEEEVDEENASIVNFTNKLIFDAADENASDIHIEPFEREIKIRFRVDGVLKIHLQLGDKTVYRQIVNRIKVLANMDTNNSKTPQSGKIRLQTQTRKIDTRISTLPTMYGEKITIRLLSGDTQKTRTLEELGMTDYQAGLVRKMMNRPNGIVLVSGPTGSGKSSTLAAVLTEISTVEKCLITIEDPVEYRIPQAIQVNIENAQGLTFASVLREVLRQDPDIIMVGEIRDLETAQIAATASNTGHLVFSTIHTNSAATVISRLSDMGVDSYVIADNIIGIISQQLVRCLCPYCKKEHIVNEDDVKKYSLPNSLLGKKVYENVGCNQCNQIGYMGRTVIPEILVLDEDIISDIHSGKSAREIELTAMKNGMIKKLDFAYSQVLAGKTSLKEVYRVLGGVSIKSE